jgi:murein L,D-transpeptidase YcbB/YkuD
MHAGKKNGIRSKIKSVYIGYFTAWQDTNFTFYDDVYNRDEALATLLFKIVQNHVLKKSRISLLSVM